MYSTQKQLENFEEIFQGKAIKVRKNTWRKNVTLQTTLSLAWNTDAKQ